MYLLLLVGVMVAPVYVLGRYIYNMDTEKESKGLINKLLLGGILSCVAVIIVSGFLGLIFPLFLKDVTEMTIREIIIYSFLCVALVEEISKFTFLYINSYNHIEFNYTFDMIVYGVITALGFALLENIFYILGGGIATGIARAFTAVPAHASNGAVMGLFLSKAKCYEVTDRNKSSMYKVLSVVLPTILHGIYDALAFSSNLLILLGFIAAVFTITLMYVKKKQKNDLLINTYNIE